MHHKKIQHLPEQNKQREDYRQLPLQEGPAETHCHVAEFGISLTAVAELHIQVSKSQR